MNKNVKHFDIANKIIRINFVCVLFHVADGEINCKYLSQIYNIRKYLKLLLYCVHIYNISSDRRNKSNIFIAKNNRLINATMNISQLNIHIISTWNSLKA